VQARASRITAEGPRLAREQPGVNQRPRHAHLLHVSLPSPDARQPHCTILAISTAASPWLQAPAVWPFPCHRHKTVAPSRTSCGQGSSFAPLTAMNSLRSPLTACATLLPERCRRQRNVGGSCLTRGMLLGMI